MRDECHHKQILIMGNGPSLNTIDFNRLNIDTFGMNNAYKYYEGMNWYPTFWGCFDGKMTAYNKEFHKEFFLRGKCKEYFTLNEELKDIPKVSYVDSPVWREITHKHYGANEVFRNVGHTGANCTQIAINNGYRKIYLIGFDGHFNGRNPNNIKGGTIKDSERQYAWADYQGENECFNALQVNTIKINLQTWQHLSEWSVKNNITVVNCNKDSQILDGLFEYQEAEATGMYK